MTLDVGPERVHDHRRYWTEPPEEISPRCQWWQKRIQDGWKPNRRIRAMGYDEAAEWFGVWIWEYTHILWPAFK